MTTEQAEQTAQETSQGTATETAEPLTPEQAQTEIDRLYSDKEFIDEFLDRNLEPGARKAIQDKITKLFDLAHPPKTGLERVNELQSEQQDQQRQDERRFHDGATPTRQVAVHS